MDLLWKDAGLDLRLNLYNVVSTDLDEGFIQVVQSAETLCRIQMARGGGGGASSSASSSSVSTPPSAPDSRLAAVFKKGLLLSWLKHHNSGPDESSMRRAQWEFTRSCAGYSVATYVLVRIKRMHFCEKYHCMILL